MKVTLKKTCSNKGKMTDLVYKYPQSSCNCEMDKGKNYKFSQDGVPTNISVRNCNISDYYNTHERRTFKVGVEPEDKKGYDLINPQVYTQSYSKDFDKITCPKGQQCEGTTYSSWDPRLFNSPRFQYITLNQPPIDDSVMLKNIYKEKLRNYGKNYKTYSDINAGQIMYYTNKSLDGAFFKPIFSEPANVSSKVYVDPMGAVKPEYDRTVINPVNPVTSNSCNYNPYGLSWIKDSQEHRADIISSQMSDTIRWQPRWKE